MNFFKRFRPFPEWTELDQANKRLQEADATYAKAINYAFSHPLERMSQTLDPNLLPKMAEIYKCSQGLCASLNENSKGSDVFYGNLKELVSIHSEFSSSRANNQDLKKQIADSASQVSKAEKSMIELRKKGAPQADIAKAEAAYQAATTFERSTRFVVEKNECEFSEQFKAYQERFVSTLAATYCEICTARAKNSVNMAAIGLDIQKIAESIPIKTEETGYDHELAIEIKKLEALLANETQPELLQTLIIEPPQDENVTKEIENNGENNVQLVNEEENREENETQPELLQTLTIEPPKEENVTKEIENNGEQNTQLLNEEVNREENINEEIIESPKQTVPDSQ